MKSKKHEENNKMVIGYTKDRAIRMSEHLVPTSSKKLCRKCGKMKHYFHKIYCYKCFEDELKKGTKVEMEHTNDPELAEKIARDHLNENPYYYTKLKECGL